jgi:hypothetical protein
MKVIVGQAEWAIADTGEEVVRNQIRTAMAEGAVAELVLYDSDKRPVTVYLNCRIIETIVVDTDSGPRPGEISG